MLLLRSIFPQISTYCFDIVLDGSIPDVHINVPLLHQVSGYLIYPLYINSFLPGQNGRHFVDHIFRCICVNEKFCILIKISLKFVPKGPIDNKPALVKIMAWRQPGDKQLLEPMLIGFTDAYMRHWGKWIYPVAHGRCGDIKCVIFHPICGTDISSKISLWWMLQNHFDDKSTLLQVMAWCHQAPSHYLKQCWLNFYNMLWCFQSEKVKPFSMYRRVLLSPSNQSPITHPPWPVPIPTPSQPPPKKKKKKKLSKWTAHS